MKIIPPGSHATDKPVVRKTNWQPAKSSSPDCNNTLFLFYISSPDKAIPAQWFNWFGTFIPVTVVKCSGRSRKKEETKEFSRANACMSPRQDFSEEWSGYHGGFSPQGHRLVSSEIKTRSLNEREGGQAKEE